MGTTESIILRHSGRGMDLLREYLPEDYITQAAKAILSWKKGTVVLTTGFYVAGFAETDGPAGTIILSKALKALGYHPVIVTDLFCKGFFEPEEIDTVYMELDCDQREAQKLLETLQPVGMISIERCGINVHDDYENMRGISIREHTAPCDLLFELAPSRGIPTIGVGDGGNEIGMGNLQEVISKELPLVPCRVKTDHLVIASVSNWGAYGIAAKLEELTGKSVYSVVDGITPAEKVYRILERTVSIGSVDGVTHERIAHVDGFDGSVEMEIVTALLKNFV